MIDLPLADFPELASLPRVTVLSGDFDGDNLADIALVGGFPTQDVVVAFSRSDERFFVRRSAKTSFSFWANLDGVRPVTGDFDGDGRTDIALVGGAGWASVPMAFSRGDGTFTITNPPLNDFPLLSRQPGALPIGGDFNHDGRGDIALVGGVGWTGMPVAFYLGDGAFHVTFLPSGGSFAQFAQAPGATPVSGDFNGDGLADVALIGGGGWQSIPVAFSRGNGRFIVTNFGVPAFNEFFTRPGSKAVPGDFNGDGFADIALTGGLGWESIPVAFSNGVGGFTVTNSHVATFPGLAAANFRTQPITFF